MDLFVPLVLLALSGFCWLLAAGERKDRQRTEGQRRRDHTIRYAYSPLRAAAPAIAGLAVLVASVQFFTSRGIGAFVVLAAGTVVAIVFVWRAICIYKEYVDYVPGKGLRVARWSGHSWMPFERIAHVAYDSGGWLKPDNHIAGVTIRTTEGGSVTLNEALRGFEQLVERLCRDCPEGVVEIDMPEPPPERDGVD